jgi:hypothetical protein
MPQGPNKGQEMNLPAEETGMRPGFLVLVTCVAALLLVSLWYLNTRPVRSREFAQTPPPVEPETAVAALPSKVQTMQIVPPAHRRVPRHSRQRMAAVAPAAQPMTTLEDTWGIQVCSMRLSMGNSAVDLRYKILDPEKAALLGRGKTPAFIVDRSTGRKLIMPTPPKEGAFPPSSIKLVAGRTYFAMVSNQGGTLKSGSEVTVVVGGSGTTNLTVE